MQIKYTMMQNFYYDKKASGQVTGCPHSLFYVTNTYELVSLGHIKDRKIHIGELTEEQKLIIECEKMAQEALDSGVW